MDTHLYLWGSVIAPWFTLFFMKKEEIKRYMPVALFGALITTIVAEIALASDWWIVKDAIYPLYHLAPYTYGAFLVGTIWIFKFTFCRIWLFLVVDLIFNIFLNYPIINFMSQRGILDLHHITSFQLLLISTFIGVLLYGYQLWQEQVLVSFESSYYYTTPTLKPAAAKPLKNRDDWNNPEK